jgi:hypothetical protein
MKFNNHSNFVHTLQTQKAESPTLTRALPCPYPGHDGRMFLSLEQLYDHAKDEHATQFEGLRASQARDKLKDAVLALRYEMSRVIFPHHAKISAGKLMAH